MLHMVMQSHDPVDYDPYEEYFLEMLAFAEQAYSNNESENERTPHFDLDHSGIPVLFVVVASCRNPQIRRRACRLLQQKNVHQGLWNSLLAGHVAERLINIEEDAARTMGGKDCEILSASDIPAEARVVLMALRVQAGGNFATLSFSNAAGSWQEALRLS